jgi:hypothetical protein
VEKKSLKFKAAIIFDTEKLEDISCEIVFPKTQDEKVILKAFFDFNNSSWSKIPFIFSLKATIYDWEGNLSSSIFANKVYNLGIESSYSSYYAPDHGASILTAEPVDLKIQDFIKQADHEENQKNFYFWLTQSIQLAPAYSLELHYNGNVSVNTVNSKSFEIIEGLKFNFINYYFYYDEPKRKNTRFSKSVLAAEFNGVTEHQLGESILLEMELFLKLVSFSERRRVVCYGYRGFSGNALIEFYKGDIYVPKEDFEHSVNEVLIDIGDFEDFIGQAFLAGKNCVFKEHLFDAIGKTAYREYSTLESEYLSYYSALENLVNGYRDTHSLHYILEVDHWKGFTNDLKAFIKTNKHFKDEKEKRKLLYEKIQELNRVSFGTAFKSFCEFYQVDLSDLWSIGGGEVTTSLTKIRNRLIHGGRFDREEFDALMCAKSHLTWTLERCILRVLDWDVERSKVRPTFLNNYIHYHEWKGKMKLLKNC